MSIAICPECGGEGCHEIPRPQRDDPFYCEVRQCRHCGGVGRIEEDGPADHEVCPYCGGTDTDPNTLNDPGPCALCGGRGA